MRLKLLIGGFCFLILCNTNLLAQIQQDTLKKDTILLTDGKFIYTSIVDTSEGIIKYRKPRKPSKILKLGEKEIFSVRSGFGENVYYAPDPNDSISADNYSVEEMRYFILGIQDGKKAKFKTVPFVANFLIGAGAGVTGHFLSPLVPFMSTAIFTIRKPKLNQNHVSNMEYLNHATYEKGYKQETTRKKKVQTLLGGGLGFLVGITTSFILSANGIDLIK
jgi:hypothetical protein